MPTLFATALIDISPISKRIFACCNRTAVIYSVYDEPVTALKSLEKCDGERQAKSATFCRLAPYSRLFSAYIIAFWILSSNLFRYKVLLSESLEM